MSHFFYFLKRQSKVFIVLASFGMIVTLGLLDGWLMSGISVAVFYLVPILTITWFVGPTIGMLAAGASALSLLLADISMWTDKLEPVFSYWNALADLLFFLVVSGILNELKKALKREQELARTDYVTGAANGRAFYELAATELNRIRRNHYPITVAFLDIDNFKLVNDRFGHNIGDSLLYLVAEIIKSNIRSNDIIARMGGDEFLLLLPETGVDAAKVVLNRLRKFLMTVMENNEWPVTFSIGSVTFTDTPESVDEMITRADHLMYSVKNNGKNQLKQEVVGMDPAICELLED